MKSLVNSQFQLRNAHSLNDNIACTADNPQSLTLNHTARTRPDQGLVRVHGDAKDAGVITETVSLERRVGMDIHIHILGDRDLGSTSLIVVTPTVLVDC